MERFHNPYGDPGETGDKRLSGWPIPRELHAKNMVDDPLVFERGPFVNSAGLRDSHLIRAYSDLTAALPRGLS